MKDSVRYFFPPNLEKSLMALPDDSPYKEHALPDLYREAFNDPLFVYAWTQAFEREFKPLIAEWRKLSLYGNEF